MRKKISILLREWADAELRTSAANPEAHLGYIAAKRIDEQEAQIAALQERVHLCTAYDELERESETLQNVSAIVDEQAEDYGLWFVAHTAPEAYLQKALRRLHAAVEGDK